MWAHSPFPRPVPLKSLGQGVFFGILWPCPRSDQSPAHTPDRFLFKIEGSKEGPARSGEECGWTLEGGRAGITRKIPRPGPSKGRVWRIKSCPPHPVMNTYSSRILLS